jgi:hypothetical protein
MAVFALPVVQFCRALAPMAVLKLALVFDARASAPTAVLLNPEREALDKAVSPTAILFVPVLACWLGLTSVYPDPFHT